MSFFPFLSYLITMQNVEKKNSIQWDTSHLRTIFVFSTDLLVCLSNVDRLNCNNEYANYVPRCCTFNFMFST